MKVLSLMIGGACLAVAVGLGYIGAIVTPIAIWVFYKLEQQDKKAKKEYEEALKEIMLKADYDGR